MSEKSYSSQLPTSAYSSSSSSYPASSYPTYLPSDSSSHHHSSHHSHHSEPSYSSQLPSPAYGSSSPPYSSPASPPSSHSSGGSYSSQLPSVAYGSSSPYPRPSSSSDYSEPPSYSSHSSYSPPPPTSQTYSSALPPSAYGSSSYAPPSSYPPQSSYSPSPSPSQTYTSALPPSAYGNSSYTPPPSSSSYSSPPPSYSSPPPSSYSSPPPSYSSPPPSSDYAPPPSTASGSFSSQLPAAAYASASSSTYRQGPSPYPTSVAPKRAVLVGVNYLRTPESRLHGCVNDASFMKHLLITKFGFSEKDMVILTDDSQDPNKRPTKGNIINALVWLTTAVKPGDSLFFSFSGHGSQTPDSDGDEVDGMDETILPEDYKTAGQIVDDDLHRMLAARIPAGAKLTCVMDCCHSGTGLDLPYVYSHGRIVTEKNVAKRTTQGDVVLFSGCADSQTSSDTHTLSNVGFSGVLTYCFCQSIESSLSWTHAGLLESMQKYCTGKGFTQIIQLSSGKPFDLSSRFAP